MGHVHAQLSVRYLMLNKKQTGAVRASQKSHKTKPTFGKDTRRCGPLRAHELTLLATAAPESAAVPPFPTPTEDHWLQACYALCLQGRQCNTSR